MSSLRTFRSLDEARGQINPGAVTVGNFDGVHCGHQLLVQTVCRLSAEHPVAPSVLTFFPHPARVLSPAQAPALLNTLEERLALLEQAGVRQALVLPFTQQLANWTPQEFAERVLADTLQARHVVVGDNFRFGHKQGGDTRLLQQLGQQLGFQAHIVPALQRRGKTVSSSHIRQQIREGNVGAAARSLGRWYALSGPVVSGQGIGSRQTVPTLNIDTQAEVLPADGVYVTRTLEPQTGRQWTSITNIGMRPTFQGDSRTVETYLLSPLEGGTPERITLQFLRRVRDERRFTTPTDLKQQILADVQFARRFHHHFHNVSSLLSKALLR